ncbi:MAG: hypothetical protein HRU20_19855 [Pseudomonadales bacterium]|nr:hypothetical protein [Pseudomonadales bacterium]
MLGHNSETAGDMTAALHVRNADINSDEIRMVESDLPGHYTVELVFDNGTINTNSINMPYSSVHSDEVLTIDSKLELKNATINTTSATDLGGNLRAASNSSNVQGQFNNTITFDNVVFNSGGDIEIASDLLNGSNSTGNHVGINTVLTIKKSTINAIDLEFARWNNSNTGSQNGSSSNTITADISDSTLILQNLYISDVSAKGDNTTLYTQDINLNISNSTVTATGQLEMLEYGVGAEARSNSAVVLSVNNSQMTFGADLFMAEDLQFTDALALSETVATAALQLNRSEMTFGETMFLADMGEEDMGLAVNVDMQANLQAVNSLISAQELRAGSGMGKSTIQLHNSLLTLKDMDDGVAGDTDTLLIDEASLTLGQTNTLSLTLAGSQRADNTVVLSNDNFYSAIDAHQVTLGGTLKVAINQEAVASGRTEFDLIRAVAIDDSVTLGESAVRGIHGAFDTVSYVLEEGITVDKTEIVRENIAGIDYDIYRLYVAYEQTEQPTVASNSGSDSGHTPLSGLLLLLSLLFIRRR